MDIRKIKKLIELVEESGIAELEISEGEESVRISRNSPVSAAPAPVQYAAAPAPAAAPHLQLLLRRQRQQHQQTSQQLLRVTKFFLQWLVRSTALQVQMRNHL